MEEKKNFLEVLQEELEKLQADGLISEEELRKGFLVDFRSLHFKELDRKVLSLTMGNILKKRNPSYLRDSENGKRYNPHTISRFKVQRKDENIVMSVLGKDGWTKFFITNEKNDQSDFLQLTPEEFIETYCQTRNTDRIRQIQNNLGLTTMEINSISELVNNPKEDAIYARGINTSFNEMMRDFAEYSRYYLEEVETPVPGTELGQDPEQPLKQGVTIIEGGIIEQEKGQRINTKPTDRPSGGPRKNEIIPYEQREKILLDLDPEIIVNNDTIDKDGTVIKGTYHTFIYRNPQNKDGYLLIAEPYSGDKSTRLIYISDKQIQNFLMDGQELDNDIWNDITRYYLETSLEEFRKEANTYVSAHRNLETYDKLVRGILDEQQKYIAHTPATMASLNLYSNVRVRYGFFATDVSNAIKEGKVSTEDLSRISTRIKYMANEVEQEEPTQGGEEL